MHLVVRIPWIHTQRTTNSQVWLPVGQEYSGSGRLGPYTARWVPPMSRARHSMTFPWMAVARLVRCATRGCACLIPPPHMSEPAHTEAPHMSDLRR